MGDPDGTEPPATGGPPSRPAADPPASGGATHDPALDFDPYRFGQPEHPIPPEYAPPGYVPPPPTGTGQPPYGTYPGPPFGQYGQPPGSPYGQQPGSPYGQPPPYGYPGYGHSGPPVPPPYAMQYPQPRTGNGKATTALVLGILSIPAAILSIMDLPLIVLAIIFGVMGRNEAEHRAGGEGHRAAVIGMICGIIGGLLAVALTAFFVNKVGHCLHYDRNSTAYNNCVDNAF